MSFLIIGGERFALEFGDTVLGGRAPGALPANALAKLPPFAVITHPVDGQTTIRGLAGAISSTIGGAPLRETADVLQHGDRIEVAGVVIAYGEIQAAGRTSPTAGPTTETPLAAFLHTEGEPTASTGGRLTRLVDRSTYTIPESGLTIGREPSCGLVLASKNVSRLHATISPSMLGYTIIDKSANGVWVNGARIEGTRILKQCDVVRIGSEDLRFEADISTYEPKVAQVAEPDAAAAAAFEFTTANAQSQEPAQAVAAVEVLSGGPLKGLRFRITKPSVEIGRATPNDLQLDDESISGRHASLVQRGNGWIILDLNSRNGTFVNDEIVRDQRRLPDSCELQLGTVKLSFRAMSSTAGTAGTVGVIGITDEQVRRRRRE